MRRLGRFEFGVAWRYWAIGVGHCIAGCTSYIVGPFYVTVLRGPCRG